MKCARFRTLAISFIAAVSGCGDDEKKTNETPAQSEIQSEVVDGCTSPTLELAAGGAAVVTTCTSKGTTTVKLGGTANGSEYIFNFFALGPKSVYGADSSNLTYDFSASGLTAKEFGLSLADRNVANIPDAQSMGQTFTVLINRFDAARGEEGQGLEFWLLVDSYDRQLVQLYPNAKSRPGRLKDFFTDQIAAAHKSAQLKLLAGGSCPAQGASVPGTSGTAAQVVNETSYCIVYVDDPLFASDKSKIKAAMDTITSTYSDVVFKGQDLAASSTFTFKPVIVFVQASKITAFQYPSSGSIIGAFHRDTSANQGVPYVYMIADLEDVFPNDESDPNANSTYQRNFYGTLAHEIFHTYSYYFKSIKNPGGDQETIAIEEGMAHFFEDVFGHGDKAASVAEAYLGNFPLQDTPIFGAAEDSVPTRGGALSLLYYISSRLGGVTFSSGRVSGGGGLKFLTDMVISNKIGRDNLQAALSGTVSLAQVFGDFGAALVLDNTNVGTIAEKHTVQKPAAVVTDLTGTQNRTYGFRFNHNRSSAGPIAEGYAGPLGNDLKYFQFAPFYYSVSGAEPSIKLSFAGESGAISIVRVK